MKEYIVVYEAKETKKFKLVGTTLIPVEPTGWKTAVTFLAKSEKHAFLLFTNRINKDKNYKVILIKEHRF